MRALAERIWWGLWVWIFLAWIVAIGFGYQQSGWACAIAVAAVGVLFVGGAVLIAQAPKTE